MLVLTNTQQKATTKRLALINMPKSGLGCQIACKHAGSRVFLV